MPTSLRHIVDRWATSSPAWECTRELPGQEASCICITRLPLLLIPSYSQVSPCAVPVLPSRKIESTRLSGAGRRGPNIGVLREIGIPRKLGPLPGLGTSRLRAHCLVAFAESCGAYR